MLLLLLGVLQYIVLFFRLSNTQLGVTESGVLQHFLSNVFINSIIHANNISLNTFKKHLNATGGGFFFVALMRETHGQKLNSKG